MLFPKTKFGFACLCSDLKKYKGSNAISLDF